jgi:hypothetical protein
MRQFDHGGFLQRRRAEAASQRFGIAVVLAKATIAQQQRGILVAGQEPAAEWRLPDRGGGTQRTKNRVRVGQKRGSRKSNEIGAVADMNGILVCGP